MALKRNLIGNLAGSGWQAVMSLAFIPVYIHHLGVGAYGLIGMYIALQTIIFVFDFGMSSASLREISRLSTCDNKIQFMSNYIKTVEIIFWAMSLLLCIVLIPLMIEFSDEWFASENIPSEAIRSALIMMCVAIALQWPSNFYISVIMGFERHISLNVINSISATFRGAGSAIIVWLISPTIQAFFIWHIVINLITTITMAIYIRQIIPNRQLPKVFNLNSLLSVRQFAIGISGISFASLIIGQFDKLILSKLLTLESFGYYAFASLAATSINRFFTPIFNTAYPRFSHLVESGNKNELIRTFHQLSQYMVILIAPAAMTLAFFSYEIVNIWTGKVIVALNTSVIISILVSGVFLNGLLNVPYALQLAHGWTALNLKLNIIAAVAAIPLILILTNKFGATGAAVSWLAINIFFFIAMPLLMHRKLLTHELGSWISRDVVIPFLAASLVMSLAKYYMPTSLSRFSSLLYIITAYVISLLAVVWSTSGGRLLLSEMKRKFVRGIKQ
jgi:O-antigen/teichoic acid export membrane protein